MAPASEQLARADALGDCMRRLRDMDARIDAAGVRDAQAARVDGYPFLRADRYTASRTPGDREALAVAQAKLDRMAALDAEARKYESANARIADVDQAALERCRAELVAATRGDAERAANLASPPHSYDDAMRVVGLYPVTKFPFVWGVAAWQQTTRDLYATPFPELTVKGKRIRYVPGPGSFGASGRIAPDRQRRRCPAADAGGDACARLAATAAACSGAGR